MRLIDVRKLNQRISGALKILAELFCVAHIHQEIYSYAGWMGVSLWLLKLPCTVWFMRMMNVCTACNQIICLLSPLDYAYFVTRPWNMLKVIVKHRAVMNALQIFPSDHFEELILNMYFSQTGAFCSVTTQVLLLFHVLWIFEHIRFLYYS